MLSQCNKRKLLGILTQLQSTFYFTHHMPYTLYEITIHLGTYKKDVRILHRMRNVIHHTLINHNLYLLYAYSNVVYLFIEKPKRIWI